MENGQLNKVNSCRNFDIRRPNNPARYPACPISGTSLTLIPSRRRSMDEVASVTLIAPARQAYRVNTDTFQFGLPLPVGISKVNVLRFLKKKLTLVMGITVETTSVGYSIVASFLRLAQWKIRRQTAGRGSRTGLCLFRGIEIFTCRLNIT